MSDFGIEIKTSKVFPEVKIVKTEPWYDYRGEMWTTWESEWDILPEGNEWKISKFTRSRKNVLRGLHGDDVTWKFVHCVYGELYQVVVDNRPESANYLKWEGYILSDRNHIGILIPAGFVNGHLCLTDECVFHYMQSYPNEYVDWFDQEEVKWNDSQIGIEWPIDNPILNWRDK